MLQVETLALLLFLPLPKRLPPSDAPEIDEMS